MATCCAAAIAPLAQADEDELQPHHLQAALTTIVTSTNNFYYEPTNERSATGVQLSPQLRYLTQTSATSLNLWGNADYAVFSAPGSKDDFLDRATGGTFGWTPTFRNRFSIDGGLKHGHDPFGTVRTEGTALFTQDLDQWNRTSGSARYRYGAPSATLNAEVGVNAANVDYTTNRGATQFLDYQTRGFDYNVYYNYTPKTSLVASFSRTGVSFDQPFGPIDTRGGVVYQARAGIRWLATAKTSGDVRAGYRQRTFDNVSNTFEGFDWQASVQWSPIVPLLVEVNTARSEDQSYRIDASVIDVRSSTLKISRVVNSRARFTLSGDDSRSKFIGSTRYDESRNGGVGLEYAALSNLFLVANVSYGMRESTVAGLDYHRMGGFVGLRFGRLR